MKDRIEAKIELLIEFIIHKPLEEVTIDDYMILATELQKSRFQKERTENEKRKQEFVCMVSDCPLSIMGAGNKK